MSGLAQPFQAMGGGPVHAEVTRLLGSKDGVGEVRVAARSPLGDGAVRVAVSAAPEELARSLEREPWVAAAVARPTHIYLRIESQHFISWVVDGYVEHLRPAGAPQRPPSLVADEESLAGYRSRLVSAALGRIVGAEDEAATGSVDVRYGPLRMKSGGEVGVDDLRREMERRLGAESRSQDCATAVALLDSSRKKHIRVDERWVSEGAQSFRHVQLALAPIRRDQPAATNGDGARMLALELERLQLGMAFAAEHRDPVYLTRSLFAVARRAAEAPSSSALGRTAADAIRLCLWGLWGDEDPAPDPSEVGSVNAR